jgi:hypothetical protein
MKPTAQQHPLLKNLPGKGGAGVNFGYLSRAWCLRNFEDSIELVYIALCTGGRYCRLFMVEIEIAEIIGRVTVVNAIGGIRLSLLSSRAQSCNPSKTEIINKFKC